MKHLFSTALLTLGTFAALPMVPALAADSPAYDLKYKFKTGDVIRYEVKHRMSVRNTIDEETQQATSQTDSLKSWRITDVLPSGDIELINMVEKVRMQNKLPGKDDLVYDSEKDGEPPAGFEDTAKAIGVPISVVRITDCGKILKRESKVYQPAADPNASVTALLPQGPVAIGDTWDEPLKVKVQLEDGGTKAIEARRHYKLSKVTKGIAEIGMSYQVLSPMNPHIEAQLIQRLMTGTIKFDIRAGRVISQLMEVDKRVLGYAGPTSSMHYVMRMEERIAKDVPEVASKP